MQQTNGRRQISILILSFFLNSLGLSADGEGGGDSLLRPKGSFDELGPKVTSCPGRGTCMSAAACEEEGGIRKMGLCPQRKDVCCKIDVPVLPKCGASSNEWVTKFSTPGYPNLTNGSTECMFNLFLLPGVCAIKIDFEDVLMAGSIKYASTHKCVSDTFFILNIPNAPADPICDMQNYSAIFSLDETVPNRRKSSPVKFLFVIQSKIWKLMMKVTQLNCQEIIPWQNEPLCGRQLMYDPPLDENQLNVDDGLSSNAEKALIVNGQNAEVLEFPWQVSIQTKGGSHRCGASIIRPNLLLSASHCFSGFKELDTLNVRLGTGNASREGELVEIESIIQHYEYKPFKSHLNDIAILRLKSNITYSAEVQPICLPLHGDTFGNGDAVVSGWGLLSGAKDADSPEFLQKLPVKLLPNADCSERMIEAYALTLGRKVHVDPVSLTQICAVAEKNSTVCFGDSGGPLVSLNSTDGTYTQVGIVSYGVGRCVIKHVMPVVYTRVSEFLQFIAIAATA